MKTLNFILLLAFLGFLNVACSKEEQFVTHDKTTVEGVLLSAADRSPIPNGKVLLLSDAKGDLTTAIWHGRWYSTRNELITDAQGHFSYRFKHSDDTVYAIAAEADGFFPNINSGGYDYPNWRASGLGGVKKGYKNYFTQANDSKDFQNNKGIVYLPEIRLAPEGWIKLRVKNQTKKYQTIHINGVSEDGNTGQTFNGLNVDEVLITLKRGGLDWSFPIFYYENGQPYKLRNDTVYCQPHDTVYHEIIY